MYVSAGVWGVATALPVVEPRIQCHYFPDTPRTSSIWLYVYWIVRGAAVEFGTWVLQLGTNLSLLSRVEDIWHLISMCHLKFWSVVLEDDVKRHLDVCEKWSIAWRQGVQRWTEICYVQWKEGRLAGLVTFYVGTAFWNILKEGWTEVTVRLGRRRKQLLSDLKETQRFWKFKEAALDRTV